MRIVFFMRNVGYIRNFEWVMRSLAAKGHQIRILFDNKKMLRSEQAAHAYLKVLCKECSNIEFDNLIPPNPYTSIRAIAIRTLRLAQDYLRYFEPVFEHAEKPRERSGKLLNTNLRFFINLCGRNRLTRGALSGILSGLDRLIPPRSYIVNFLREANPDLLMVTPLFSHGSYQADYFKAASMLGIRTCLPVASWDNLTSKGLAHAEPDCVLVWNEPQKWEAIELQKIAPENVIVTGAHTYDHWFTWKPSTSREEFLTAIGLANDQPYLLYLGSSLFIAPDEPPVVLKWATALRESGDPLLKNVGILIRPHPQNAVPWSKIDVSFLGNAVVHPRLGSNPVSRDAKAEFYDSMYHCKLVVGVNTSAMIEAGILGKPVHTVLFDDTTETQEGTLHFHHLAAEKHGLLHIATTLDDHVKKLSVALREAADDATRSKRFVDWFVRPPELKKLPTEFCVDVIEKLGREPAPAPRRPSVGTILLRVAAAPLLLPIFVNPKYLRTKYFRPLWRYSRKVWQVAEKSIHRKFFRHSYKHHLFRKNRKSRRLDQHRQARSGMKILLLLNYPGYMRYFDGVIRGLLDRGHAVHVSFEDNRRQVEGLEALQIEHPNLTVDSAHFPRREDLWRGLARALRGTTDYVRYLDQIYRNSQYLRGRTAKALPTGFRFIQFLPYLPTSVVRRLRRVLVRLERAIPSAKAVEHYLMKVDPDVLLVSPLVNVRSWQTDAVKSAQALDIKTGLCVASWDHLTTKGLIRVKPDKVFVWNPIQKREAFELHDIPLKQVVVTGAQPFDKWFDREPSESRDQFCRRVGFPGARPFVLFVGSTSSISKPEAEVEFVRAWLKVLRGTEGPLREIGILVRPHPFNCRHWKGVDLGNANTIVYPRDGANPVNERDRADYFHSLYYCAAVVGINTSAMVEATILGRPVLTVLDRTFGDTQQGTLHFHYLLPEHGGFLEVAKSLEEHATQLTRAIENPALQRERLSAFVDQFVRPCGRNTNATQLLIEAIEELGQGRRLGPVEADEAMTHREAAE